MSSISRRKACTGSAQAVELADELLEWEWTHRASQIRVRATRERCRVLALRGPVELAAAPLEELLVEARKASDPQTVIPILALGATIELARATGRRHQARAGDPDRGRAGLPAA